MAEEKSEKRCGCGDNWWYLTPEQQKIKREIFAGALSGIVEEPWEREVRELYNKLSGIAIEKQQEYMSAYLRNDKVREVADIREFEISLKIILGDLGMSDYIENLERMVDEERARRVYK